MKKYTVLFFLFLTVFNLSAAPIDLETAYKVSANFMKLKAVKNKFDDKLNQKEYKLLDKGFYINIKDTIISYYVISLNDFGWVIVSADDRTEPVLAFSPENNYSAENLPVNFMDWACTINENIRLTIENDVSASNSINQKWDLYKSNLKNNYLLLEEEPMIEPLIQTYWNQGYPFNIMCPYDEDAKQRTITGCVATAMAQVLKYHNYPRKGIGTFGYTHPVYGELNVNFEESVYDYKLMKARATEYKTEEEREAVAKLMYDCGVGSSMGYGVNASGAYLNNAANALSEHFNYTFKTLQFSQFTEEQWKDVLYDDLNFGLPVYYVGYGPAGGHAFVCDGYKGDYFHFNWGWGGAADGYFLVTNLNPGTSFTSGQQIFSRLIPGVQVNVEPDIYEFNNIEESAFDLSKVIKMDNTENHFVPNLHENSDVDIYKIALDKNHRYLLRFNVYDRRNNIYDTLLFGEVKNSVKYEGNDWRVVGHENQIVIKNSDYVLIKVESLKKYNYGNYIIDLFIKESDFDYIKLENLQNEDSFQDNSLVEVKWESNVEGKIRISSFITDFPDKRTILGEFDNNGFASFRYNGFTNYKHRIIIQSVQDTTLKDTSELFMLLPRDYIYIIEPSSYYSFYPGFPVDVSWESNFTGPVDIDLMFNDVFYTSIANELQNDGYYEWKIQDWIGAGDNYQLRISSTYNEEVISLSEAFRIFTNTSVEDEKSNEFNIFRNSKIIQSIQLNDGFKNMSIYNYLGQILNQFRIDKDIYLDNLNSGIYFLRFSSDTSDKLIKIMLE